MVQRGLGSPPLRRVMLSAVVMEGVPAFDADGGCDPYFTIQVPSTLDAQGRFVMDEIFDWRVAHSPLRHLKPSDGGTTFNMSPHGEIVLCGDVKLLFADQACAPHVHRMCTACAPHVHRMRTACAPHAHRMRTACAPHAHRMCIEHACACEQHVHM